MICYRYNDLDEQLNLYFISLVLISKKNHIFIKICLQWVISHSGKGMLFVKYIQEIDEYFKYFKISNR